MRKILHALIPLLLLLVSQESKAQLNNVTVDPGPYTPGSTIAVKFSTGSTCIPIGNTFQLFLSDASGNFGTAAPIGTYSGFYGTFVNGVIPAGTPAGTGYLLRVTATGTGASATSAIPVVISATGAAAEAKLTSPNTFPNTPQVTFGNCNTDENTPNTSFSFTNASTASTATVSIVNELNPGVPALLTFTPGQETQFYTASLAHFTLFVRAVMPDGTVSTKAYFLVNNLAVTAFTTTSGNTVCYPTGTFEYRVDVTTNDGIKINFPGNTYHIDWGDATSNDYTYCSILNNSSKVGHTFAKSSCGLSYTSGTQTVYNAFGVNVGVVSPFCGAIGSPLSTPARVVSRPVNKFSYPPVACLGDVVTFVNSSLPGQKANTNSPGCANNNMLYSWYVDGNLVQANKPLSYSFLSRFTTRGQHIVRLTSVSDGGCQADAIEQEICVQNPPQASFTLPATTLCLAAPSVAATSTSVVDNICPSASPVYTWTVTPAAGVTFTGGTSASSVNPVFNFSRAGVYSVALTIRSGTCQNTSPAQEIVVNTVPQASLSPSQKLCALASFTFGPAAGITKTTVSGTSKPVADTYTWAVSGGAYNFAPGEGPNTPSPTISFTEYAVYTVTLTHQNNCGTATASQTLSFSESPVPLITVNPTACYQTPISLQASITPATNTTFAWSSSGRGTFADPSSLNTTYTPSAADLAALSITFTLTVNTGIPGDCAVVRDIKTVTIFPNNTGSAATLNSCSGDLVSYTPAASVAQSTFTWTAANADGFANGYSASGSGAINDRITNNNPGTNAVVVYTITPAANGCPGVPYTLTVSVAPLPVATAAPSKAVICSNQPAGIVINANLPGTRYTWTSTATGVSGNTSNTTAATSPLNDLLVNTGTTQGSVTYTIVPVSATGCTGSPVTVTVLVDPAVTVANAGPDESICNLGSYTLNGNLPRIGSGTWSLVSPQQDVTITDPSLYNTTVSGLRGGETYIFRWTISGGGTCDPSADEVTLTDNLPAAGGITAGAATVCQGSNSGTITLSGNTGTVLNWESSADGGQTWVAIAQTAAGLSYSNITATTSYRAIVRNGTCDSKASAPTTITVVPATTVAAAGPDQSLCAQTSAVLDANTPANPGESGQWTLVSGSPNATLTNPADPKTTVTNLVAGQNYSFRWTITGNSPCGPTSATMNLLDLPPLTNSVSSTSTVVCYGQQIVITGSNPSGGDGNYTYLWEISTDGTSWTPINGQAGKDLSYRLLSTSWFRRTVFSSSCTLLSNTLQIIAQPPIANNTIAADQTICTGLVPAGLTGSIPTGSDGNFNYQWQLSTDNGSTWRDISGAVFLNYAPPALTTTSLYRRTVSTITCNGSQASSSNTVSITVKPDAKAAFTYKTDKACAPFILDANSIKATPYPDRNDTYTWYADQLLIGTGIKFPGYTIATSNTAVTIRLVVTPSQGCQPDAFSHVFSTAQSVAASFSQSATAGCGPLTVSFVNTSTSLTEATFRWDFGNGTTSSQVMPAAVVFQPDPAGRDTTYTLSLTATTPCGSQTTTSTLLVKAKPIAVFSPSKTTGCAPLTVTFSNSSPGGSNTYYYDFGDGTLLTKTDKSAVSHTFTTNVVRDFVVTMIAENECGRDKSSYTIRVSPNTVLPELVVNADEQQGCAPLQVHFYNNSKGASLFKYDFGDGSTELTRSAPEVVIHTFTAPGTYNIVLTASNGCSDTTTTESVTVLPQPLAAFSADLRLGCPGLSVQFRNTTTSGVSYLWDFGDGTSSREFEPKHVFTGDQEYYTVSLTSTNSLGCSFTLSQNQYIHIVPPPVAQFNVVPSTLISIPDYTFTFQDESTNSPTIWAWDFGDGITSILKNPSHTYLDTGKYVVTLKVTNQQGCFTTTFKTVTILGVPGYLYLPNSFLPGSERPELRVFGAKGSGIKTWKLTIFNKWGQQLWETTKLNEGRPVESWDGTFNSAPVPQGVYFWKADVELINGTAWKGMTYDSSAPKKTGVIHLLR